MTSPRDGTPTVALLPWGNVLEDFLEPSGMTLRDFQEEFTGSWMFAWGRALALAGVRTELVCVSRDATKATRTTHLPSGLAMVILPTTRVYRALDRRMAYPYGRSARQVFAQASEPRGRRRLLMEITRELAPYLATPPVRLARAQRQGRWQAILCQEYEYPRFDVCALLGRALGTPVFACFQGGNYQRGRLEQLLRPRAIALSAGLMVGPASEVERLERSYHLPPDKIARVGNPVDLEVFRPGDRDGARSELGLPAAARVVAWHGRVAINHKGLDVLLEAWGRITRNGADDLRLLLIGGGQDTAEVDRLVAEGRLPGVVRVDHHVHDPGILSRQLAAADVYALSSRHEGFPVALIEAMACGLPVAATDVTGVRDILEGGEASGGLVVPSEDPAALAEALARLLDDPPLCAELGRRARERARSGFSLEAVGAQLRALLLGPG